MNKLGWFTPGHPAGLVVGLVIWSIWFIAMYAGLSVACQLAPPGEQQGAITWLNAGLLALTLLVAALLLFLAWCSGRNCKSWRAKAKAKADSTEDPNSSVRRFIGYISTVLYLIAATATLAGGLPVLVLSPCS